MPRRGARPKLTKKLAEKLCDLLRAGVYFGVAAEAVGIDRITCYRWRRAGKEAIEKERNGSELDKREITYATFATMCNQAVAEAEASNVQRIDEAADRDWKAAAWLLERRHGKRWKAEKEPVKPQSRDTNDIDSAIDAELAHLAARQEGGNAAEPPPSQ